ncbi:MAG: molybdopterin oxidoreductase family protein [Deltaproteobacteria bacterium]|nr:MAG: molybdopterin oxidoreductase family protein [Deltaproteobacteria bacterium]
MSPQTTTHYRTCNLCEAMCGIEVEIDGEEVVSIRGDEQDVFSRGHVCPKATALKDLYDDPDRLRQPVRRVGDRWEPMSWDDAFTEVVDRIEKIQDDHGRDAVGVYLGNPNAHNFGTLVFGPPFLRTLGSKNRFSATSCDQLPLMMASYFMYGHQLLFPVPDVDRTDFMMLIGANPLASNGSIMAAPGIKKRLEAISKRGGKVVVIDPRRCETARVADEHVFIQPGTDALFLLGLLHEVCAPGIDLGRISDSVKNADRILEIAKAYPPEQTEAITGVPADTVKRLARELRAAPKGVLYGRVGACTQEFGGLCMWLINVLNAVTGNLDEPGGSMFPSPAIDVRATAGGFGAGRGSFGRWKSRVRGFPEFGGELPASVMAEEMLTEGDGRIHAMITIAGNPVLSTPNGDQLDRGYASLDFSVSIDFFINETSRHADIILPPVSPIQRSHYDLALYLTSVRNVSKYSPAPFPLKDDELDDWQILTELTSRLAARRHGKLSKQYLIARASQKAGPERVLDLGLRLGAYGKRFNPFGTGLSLGQLKKNPHGIDLGPMQSNLAEMLPDKHGPVDLAPDIFVGDLDRLRARFLAPGAVPNDGQLLLIGRRQLRSNNSWMHNSQRLMKGKSRCTVMINPEDAERLGVKSGDQVTLRSRVGQVTAPAEITGDMMAGVVSLPHGFGHGRDGVQLDVATSHPGVSVNDLTDDQLMDELSGNAAFSGVPVTLKAAAQVVAAE